MPLLFLLVLLQQPSARALNLPTQRFVADMRSKNLEDVLSLYTPDAVFTDPGGHSFATAETLRQLYVQVFATYDSDIGIVPKNIAVTGDSGRPGAVAVEITAYRERLRTRATDTVQELCGDCVFTWVLQPDGRWLLSKQVWTSAACPAS